MAHLRDNPTLLRLLGVSAANQLISHNVRHVEDLAGLLRTKLGEEMLRNLKTQGSLSDIASATEGQIMANHQQSLSTFFASSPSQTRAAIGSDDPFDYSPSQGLIADALPFDYMSELPQGARPPTGGETGSGREHLLYENFPDPYDQGFRGTCVAFTCLAMFDFYLARNQAGLNRRLSAQYLYYLAKRADGNKYEDGTSFPIALEVLQEHGICEDTICKYEPNPDPGHALLFKDHRPSLRAIRSDYADYKLHSNDCTLLTKDTARNVKHLKAVLDMNKPIGLGVYTFSYSWVRSPSVKRSGEVILPIPVEVGGTPRFSDRPTGAHAITLLGYKDNDNSDPDSERPGGGYFIFRNSWGEDWGYASRYNPGYGTLPYRYVELYATGGCLIDAVLYKGHRINGVRA